MKLAFAVPRSLTVCSCTMGSYCSVENDIHDAKLVMMKFSPNEALLLTTAAFGGPLAMGGVALYDTIEKIRNEHAECGFHGISRGCSHKSGKLSLSLCLQINVIVVKEKDGYIRKYKGSMTTWTGPTDESCNKYYASDVPLKEF